MILDGYNMDMDVMDTLAFMRKNKKLLDSTRPIETPGNAFEQ